MNAGMNMKDIVAGLVKQSEAARRTMITDRLEMFVEMPDDQRKKAMGIMTEAVYSLSDADMRKLIATRTAVLAEMPEQKRRKLMMTHMQIIQGFSEAERMREMKMVQEAVGELPQPQKQMMVKMMEAMKGGGMPMGGGMSMSGGAGGAAIAMPATAPAAAPTWPEVVRWITLALGVWAIVVAFIFDYGGQGGVIGQLIGGIIAVLFPAINNTYWLAALAGIWLIIAPFIFGADTVTLIVSILTGIAIAILAGILAARRS